MQTTSHARPADTTGLIVVRKGISCTLGQTESHGSLRMRFAHELTKSELALAVDVLFHFHVPAWNSLNPFQSAAQIIKPEEQELVCQTHPIKLPVLVDDHLCQPNDTITKAMHVSNEELMHNCMGIDVARK